MPATLAPELHLHEPLAEQQTAVQLLLELEAAGALTETAMQTPADSTYEQDEAVAVFFGTVKRRSSWWIGDHLNACEAKHGEAFAQIAHETGLSEQTLLHYQFVCREVPDERRKRGVPFGAHALVARMTPREQSSWLRQAERKGWGERELREAIKAKRSEMHPQLPGAEETRELSVLDEVGLAILRDARPAEDGQHYLVPNEDMARLRAALGQDE